MKIFSRLLKTARFPSGSAADAALRNTLTQLLALKDPQALAALARAMAADRSGADDGAKMKELADRAKRDAAMTPPSDIRNALEQLSKKLSDPEREMDSAGFEKSDEAQPQGGVDLAGPPPQSARDASAIAALGMVALSKQEALGSERASGGRRRRRIIVARWRRHDARDFQSASPRDHRGE